MTTTTTRIEQSHATKLGGASRAPTLPGQVVLVLQGGGALGAYQAGVYQALHEAGIEPDWVIGTSIGAINAALIAGNAPERPAGAAAASSGSASSKPPACDARALRRARRNCVANLDDRDARHSRLLRAQPGRASSAAHTPLGVEQRRLLHDRAAATRR